MKKPNFWIVCYSDTTPPFGGEYETEQEALARYDAFKIHSNAIANAFYYACGAATRAMHKAEDFYQKPLVSCGVHINRLDK